MDKDFSTAVNEIMPLVSSGDKTKPFIITRDSAYGDWQVCYPNAAENADAFLTSQKKLDPFAVIFTGADFAKGSYPHVYDKVLCGRLDAELRAGVASGQYADLPDYKEVRAIYNFSEASAGEFSHKLTDFLTTVEKPLAKLAEMCPYKMATDNDGQYFNEDLAFDAIHYIENEVSSLLNARAGLRSGDEEYHDMLRHDSSKSNDDGSARTISSITLNGFLISLGEDTEHEKPFYVETQIGGDMGEYVFDMRTDVYADALKAYSEQIRGITQEMNIDRGGGDAPHIRLTEADCLPDSKNAVFTGKLIVVNTRELLPEYRSSTSQLIECTHGNGARPGAIGTSVFGKELYSGTSVVYGRHQILGLADETRLPEWAKTKLETMRHKEQASQRLSKSTKKNEPPTLLEELSDAKVEAAARNAVPKDKPQTNKRGHDEI